jgi:phage N-6-adenine-methyltransferase
MSDEYQTPLPLFNELNKRFHFRLDPCTTPSNPLGLPKFFTKEEDGLRQSWSPGPVYMAPPYSELELWTGRAWKESRKGILVVGLLPVDCSTRWWNTWVEPDAKVIPVPYRIRFPPKNTGCNFANAIVIWHGLQDFFERRKE